MENKLKDFLKNLRGVVEKFEEAPAEPQNFIEATLEDGMKIKTDAEMWAVGAAVMQVMEDGTEIPLADGTYTLPTGEQIMVSGGLIADMVSPVNVEIEMAKQEAEKAKADLAAAQAQFSALSAQVSLLEKNMKALTAAILEFSATPAEEPIIAKPSKVEVKQNRLEKISQTLNKLK